MRNRVGFVRMLGVGVMAAVTLLPSTLAWADLGFWSGALVGTWRHPSNGDVYRFNSNATYTFTAGRAKDGQVGHSGYWKIASPTESESGGSMEGPVALVLKSRKRTVRRGGRALSVAASRDFRMVVDVVHRDDAGDIERNRYLIGRARWVRVR